MSAPRLALASLTLLALVAPRLEACDSSTCAMLTRGQSGLVARGSWRLDVSFRYTDQGARREGSGATDVVTVPKVDLENRRLRPNYHQENDGQESFLQLDAAYGLGDRTNVYAALPVTGSRTYDMSHFGFQQDYHTRGLGDLLVGVRRAVGPAGLVASLGSKLPTGGYREGGDFDGTLLDPTLQPGSGSFDWVGGLQYAKGALGLAWTAAGTFQVNTRNKLDYRFGNQAIAVLGAGRSLSNRLGTSVQLKLYHQERNQFLGHGVPSTGGDFLYLTGGLNLRGPGGVSFYGFGQVLPYRRVNEAQLAPRRAALVGLSRTF